MSKNHRNHFTVTKKLPLALICIRSLKADLWFRFYSDLPVVFPCVSCLWWQAVCFEMLRYLVTCHLWQTWHAPSDIRWGNPEHANCFNCDKLRVTVTWLVTNITSQCDSLRDIWWWLWWYYPSYQSVSVTCSRYSLPRVFTAEHREREIVAYWDFIGDRTMENIILLISADNCPDCAECSLINEWGHCAHYNSPHSGQHTSCFPLCPLVFPSLWAALTPRLL